MDRRVVMILNHAFYRTGRYSQSESLKMAWKLVKQPMTLKVVGVSLGIRQRLIQRLTHYPRHMITLLFQRQPNNSYDANAIAVFAKVEGKGTAHIGFLPREWAEVFAPVLDRGFELPIKFETVTGGRRSITSKYGVRFSVNVAA